MKDRKSTTYMKPPFVGLSKEAQGARALVHSVDLYFMDAKRFVATIEGLLEDLGPVAKDALHAARNVRAFVARLEDELEKI